jgi:hypothetical protein
MVYHTAAKKTGAYMILALVLGLTITTFLAGDIAPTGNVVSPGFATESESNNILPFVLGFVTGMLVIGTYFYVAHIEKKR